MTNTLAPKVCTKCGDTYPATLEYFTPWKNKKDGLHSWCRNCVRAANREAQKKVDPEIKRRRAKERYRRHSEELLEQQKEKRRINREEVRRKGREYYQKNKAYIVEKAREKRGSKKMDEDDYTDLVPTTDRDTFREWAVITSGEYGYILQKGVDSLAGDDVE